MKGFNNLAKPQLNHGCLCLMALLLFLSNDLSLLAAESGTNGERSAETVAEKVQVVTEKINDQLALGYREQQVEPAGACDDHVFVPVSYTHLTLPTKRIV